MKKQAFGFTQQTQGLPGKMPGVQITKSTGQNIYFQANTTFPAPQANISLEKPRIELTCLVTEKPCDMPNYCTNNGCFRKRCGTRTAQPQSEIPKRETEPTRKVTKTNEK